MSTKNLLLSKRMAERFRGFYPVVVDLETAGFNSQENALLEVGACLLRLDEDGILHPGEVLDYHIRPFEGAVINEKSCRFINVDPYDPARQAEAEAPALRDFFKRVTSEMKLAHCRRAVMVAHNAAFDQGFLNAAVERNHLRNRCPFHPFSTFDTSALSGIFLGHTVLANACALAGIEYDNAQAHGARYDAEVTAKLFCAIANGYRSLLLGEDSFPPIPLPASEAPGEEQNAGSPAEDSADSQDSTAR